MKPTPAPSKPYALATTMIETSHPPKRAIWYFIKFFEQEEWANQFLAGDLYLNTLHYFKTQESSDTADRGDPTEATSLWLQPRDTIMTLRVPKLNLQTVITEKDLAAPIQASSKFHENLHIFCLTAPATDTPIVESGAISNLDVIHPQLRIDQKCFRMGKFAVAVPAISFLEQLRTTLKNRQLPASYKMVTYYDESTFSGPFAHDDIAFRKQKRFTYQREWRLCVNFRNETDSPRRLSIGRLPETSIKLSANDFPRLNEIQLRLENSTD